MRSSKDDSSDTHVNVDMMHDEQTISVMEDRFGKPLTEEERTYLLTGEEIQVPGSEICREL